MIQKTKFKLNLTDDKYDYYKSKSIYAFYTSISVVTVHCKDTRIVVNVGTNRPFSGRIYALGRSETCNVDVISSDSFRLDLTMAGQDCNTQSVVSII